MQRARAEALRSPPGLDGCEALDAEQSFSVRNPRGGCAWARTTKISGRFTKSERHRAIPDRGLPVSLQTPASGIDPKFAMKPIKCASWGSDAKRQEGRASSRFSLRSPFLFYAAAAAVTGCASSGAPAPIGGSAGAENLSGAAGTPNQAGQTGNPSGGGAAGGTAGASGAGGGGNASGGGGAGAGGAAPAAACHSVLPAASALLPTPPMGWSSGAQACNGISEASIKQAADALVSSGLRDVGYNYVIVEDCWQGARGGDGTIAAGATFPGGLQGLAQYLHSKQLKLGVGSSRGPTTCGGLPGSEGHEAADVATYAAAGADYVSIDSCHGNGDGTTRRTQFTTLLAALAAKSIPAGIEPYSDGQDIEGFEQWMASAQVFRNRGGIADSFTSFVDNVDSNADGVAYTRAGSFNDPGWLEVGNGGMTDVEYRAQMSLAAVMAAPLFATLDLTKATPATLEILANKELIAVNQDALALSGFRVGMGGAYDGGTEVWSKPLSGCGERAVVFFNRKATAASIPVTWAELGLAPGSAMLRDLWTHTDLSATSDGYTAQVPAHGAVLLKITGSELATPTGKQQLSDLPWIYAANSVGPVERDLSNRERAAKDGSPLSIAGHHYDKGLGVHAASLITYRLAGACTLFTSDVGVDDEATELASVVFQVWADGQKLFDSGVMKGKMPGKSLSVDITGKSELSLFVDNGGDDRHQDHVDWANAQVTCR